MLLNELRAPKGATHKKKRLGRGESSGLGKTSGRGNKGQKARAGGFHKTGFEGGQMPLQRRIPKRGFFAFTRKNFGIVNVADLAGFKANTEIDEATLRQAGLIKGQFDGIKILGDGDLTVALTVKAHLFTATAKTKIEKAGGKAVILEIPAREKASA